MRNELQTLTSQINHILNKNKFYNIKFFITYTPGGVEKLVDDFDNSAYEMEFNSEYLIHIFPSQFKSPKHLEKFIKEYYKISNKWFKKFNIIVSLGDDEEMTTISDWDF